MANRSNFTFKKKHIKFIYKAFIEYLLPTINLQQQSIKYFKFSPQEGPFILLMDQKLLTLLQVLYQEFLGFPLWHSRFLSNRWHSF